jgi:hypothetical protein
MSNWKTFSSPSSLLIQLVIMCVALVVAWIPRYSKQGTKFSHCPKLAPCSVELSLLKIKFKNRVMKANHRALIITESEGAGEQSPSLSSRKRVAFGEDAQIHIPTWKKLISREKSVRKGYLSLLGYLCYIVVYFLVLYWQRNPSDVYSMSASLSDVFTGTEISSVYSKFYFDIQNTV